MIKKSVYAFAFLAVVILSGFASSQSGFGSTILSNHFFVYQILPFLLVFVVVFAILQKTQVLGKEKKQIDAIVSLVVGLIVVSFGYATGVIVTLVPFLAVVAVIILVFLILYGMVYKAGTFEVHKGLRIAFGILIGIAVIVAVLFATGTWGYLINLFVGSGGTGSGFFANAIFIVIVIGAIAAVLWSAEKKDKKSED